MNVGIKIKWYLKEKNISLTELSRKTKISMPKLSLSFQGKRRLDFEEYENICWALGVGVDQFLEPRKPRWARG